MRPQLEFRDAIHFDECLRDQDSLMLDVCILRCIGINETSSYPGNPPEMMRSNIFTRAEVKPIPMGEESRNGAILAVGDLLMRIDVALRGVQGNEYPLYTGKIDPVNVADILKIDAPYQGEWFVVGIPEPGQLNANQEPLFWNVNIRRIRRGNNGR